MRTLPRPVLATPTVAAWPVEVLGWGVDALALPPPPPQPATASAAMAAAARPIKLKDLVRFMVAPLVGLVDGRARSGPRRCPGAAAAAVLDSGDLQDRSRIRPFMHGNVVVA